MPACSQCRLNIEVLFLLRIDVFFILAHTHTTHRGCIDARCWWRFIIEKEIVSIWLEFVMEGFVLVIYIAGHLCQSALWDLFLLSVCVQRRRVFPLSVVFVSATVLKTNCLIFQLMRNWAIVLSSDIVTSLLGAEVALLFSLVWYRALGQRHGHICFIPLLKNKTKKGIALLRPTWPPSWQL